MFNKIIDKKNLEAAYLNLVEKMEMDSRLGRYAGWDNLKFNDLEVSSAKLIKEVRREIVDFAPLSPAVLVKIPKKNKPGKIREIYIYSLKDRVKAQAVYQIVEPYFDNYFSPWLFSYRSSHPSYFAARSTVRHYQRYYRRDSLVVADMADYSSYIQYDILISKIRKMGFSEEMVKLLALFVCPTAIRDGEVIKPEFGLVTGTPLIGLFNNLYLDELDKYCGKNADFYRRVGDDLIIFDKSKDRLQILYDYLIAETKDLGLLMHAYKTKFIPATQKFSYLGYSFNSGVVSFSPGFVNHALQRWSSQFNYYNFKSLSRKINYLRSVLSKGKNNLLIDFRELAKQKKLVNDGEQVRCLSESFFHILTRYFFKTYTPKNRRRLAELLKNMHLNSIYKYFLNIIYGYRR